MKGIIFDMDGTLWDSAKAVADSWSEIVVEKYGEEHRIFEDDIKAVMGKPMNELADIIFDFVEDEDERYELLDVCGKYENEYLIKHGGVLYPDLEDTFKKLKENYNLYIVSNCQSGYIEAFLEHYGFEKYFDDIECFGNNNLMKDENIRKIVERNNLEKAVYVGDIQGDYDSTMKAGIDFILADYGFGSVDKEVPKIEKFSDLINVAKEILG